MGWRVILSSVYWLWSRYVSYIWIILHPYVWQWILGTAAPFQRYGLTLIPTWITFPVKSGMKLLIHSQTTTLVPKLGKHPLFADSGRKKTHPFQLKSLILRSNITHLFTAKCDFIFIMQDKIPFYESEINGIKRFYCLHRIFHYVYSGTSI